MRLAAVADASAQDRGGSVAAAVVRPVRVRATPLCHCPFRQLVALSTAGPAACRHLPASMRVFCVQRVNDKFDGRSAARPRDMVGLYTQPTL